MENISIDLLTSTNYFQWKFQMEDLSRSKGIYKITLGTETAPIDDEEKVAKWNNKNDQTCVLIGMSISPYLRLHLDGLNSSVEAWEMSILSLALKMRFKLISLKKSYLP